MSEFFAVADLDTPAPEPFAVLAIDRGRRAANGGYLATVVSLHMTRVLADRAAETLNTEQHERRVS